MENQENNTENQETNMEYQENNIETPETKKEPINIWKISFISVITVALLVFLGVNFYNSDWFINQTLHVKKTEDAKLGKHTTWSYSNKYDGNLLKLNITVKNVDPKVLDIVNNYTDDDEDIMLLIFNDKDNFKLAELKITKDIFIANAEKKGEYRIQTSIQMDKKTVRKVYDIDAKYRAYVDMTYKELLKEIRNNMSW